MQVYTTPTGQSFRASAARKGTQTAQTRPLTLLGTGIVRFTLNDEETAAYLALTDDTARRAYLDTLSRKTEMVNGKVVISKAALDDFVARIRHDNPATPILDEKGKPTGRQSWKNAANAVLAAYASGIVALNQITEDRTESVVDEMFPDEDIPADAS